MMQILKILLEYIICYALVFLLYYLIFIRKKTKYNKNKVPVEYYYILSLYKLSNKDVNYGDLNLYCTDGVKCRSSYLRELRDNGRLSGCGTLDDFDACEVGG